MTLQRSSQDGIITVRAGDLGFLRGLTGQGDAAAQAEQALRRAGSALPEVRRVTVHVTDRAWLAPVRAVLAHHLPAAAVVEAIVPGLPDPAMLVALDLDIGGALPLDGLIAPRPGHTPEAAAAQAEAVFDALEAKLAAAGAKLTDLCKMTMQITDRAWRQPVYGVMGRRLAGVRPVSTGLIVGGLSDPDALFQLDAQVVPGGPHERIRPYRSTTMPYGHDRQPFEAEFCMAVRTPRQVFLRGQTGLTLAGVFTGAGDPAAQARQAMANVVALLADAGCTMEHAAHATVFVTDRAFLAPVMAVVEPCFPQPIALSAMVVKGLAAPEIQMEIDVHALR